MIIVWYCALSSFKFKKNNEGDNLRMKWKAATWKKNKKNKKK